MRRFSSYGPIDTELNYYAPREHLIEYAYAQLTGENPNKGGHYITVWAPRQTGKTWVMQQIVRKLQEDDQFEVAILTMQSAKEERTDEGVLEVLVDNLRKWFGRDFPDIRSWKALSTLFTRPYFTKPLILILDEFDAIGEEFINKFANEFRSMHTERVNEAGKPDAEKSCLLHGLALIGVRTVLGIENTTGSPFNVQRNVHIPNLTHAEVEGMFQWYAQESGRQVEQAVIDRLYAETNGHPGLTCWFGELLTEGFEGYHPTPDTRLDSGQFDIVYTAALNALPNNTILNIISKAKHTPYTNVVLNLFKTDEKMLFKFDNPAINFLYLNGVIDQDAPGSPQNAVKFASPFVQKRLFNYFSDDLFNYVGKIFTPFENLDDTITDDHLDVRALMRRYERHLRVNRGWMLKDAPRRADLRIYEAVFHFNLYMYLFHFLQGFGGHVYPEFPTGNGKIDLIIMYAGTTYGLEVKSYTTARDFRNALTQAARYGKQLGVAEMTLVEFVEAVDDANRAAHEAPYKDAETGVTVRPVFVEIGEDE